MAMFKYVLYALVLLKTVESITYTLPVEQKPAKYADQEGCYFPQYDRMLQVGVPFTPTSTDNSTSCEKYTCDGDSSNIYVEDCSLATMRKKIPEVCEDIPQDYTKPYPDCCPKFRCSYPDGEVEIVPLQHYA